MNRARWLLSAAALFALWLIGALVCLPLLQRDLETAALDALSRQPALHRRLDGLHLEFAGQQARLAGSVRTQQDRSLIESTLREQVRLPAPFSAGLGRQLNPVSSVHSEIEVIPSQPGWVLLAADGARARLLGTAANAYEARDLSHSIQETWSTRGGVSEGLPGTDPEHHDEAASVATTLRTLPSPQSSAQAYLARIGQSWRELALHQSDTALFAEAHAQGVSEAEWQDQVLPALRVLRAAQERQQSTERERARLAGLPPGHLFIAVRDQQIILCGEVGTPAMKQAVLEEALKAFAPRRLHDEIRVSPTRRPSGDFGPITTALLPEKGRSGGKSCFLSISGDAWKPVDWQVAPREQSWKDSLPAGLDARLLQNDSALLSSWLHGDDTLSTASSQPTAPAFISLTLFGSRAILCGQVAEEAVRAQLIAAVRQAYGSKFLVISDHLHVQANCAPSGGIQHTLKSLPTPPAQNTAAVLAIARPGSTWTRIPVTHDLVEAGGLARSGLLPAGLPAAAVEDLSAEAIEQLRQHLQTPAFP